MELRCGCGHVVRDVPVGGDRPTCPSCDALLLRVGESATSPRATPRAFREGTHAIGQRAAVTEVGYRGSASPVGRRWVYRWARRPAVAFALALALGGLLEGWFVLASFGSALLAVFGVCLSLAGVWVLYVALGEMLNRTTIGLGPIHLTAKSGPLPSTDARSVDTSLRSDDIARFEVRRAAKPRDRVTFEVVAVHFDGRPSVLLRAMTAEHALYIAAELDDALRRDDPIS